MDRGSARSHRPPALLSPRRKARARRRDNAEESDSSSFSWKRNNPCLNEKLAVLLRLCRTEGRLDLYDAYRPAHIAALLDVYQPSVLFKHLLLAEEEWKRHYPCPEFMRDGLDGLIRTGAAFVRGNDKERRPILWCRESMIKNLRQSNSRTYCAYSIWMVLYALMLRPLDVPFITMVLDEGEKKPLNYNLEGSRRFVDAMRRLGTPRSVVYKMYVVSPQLGSRTVLKALGKLFPDSLPIVTLVRKRESVFGIPADPRDTPDYYGSPGTPYEINTTTVGDYQTLFFRNGPSPIAEFFNGPFIETDKENSYPSSARREIHNSNSSEESGSFNRFTERQEEELG